MKKLILLFILIPSVAWGGYFEPFDSQDWWLQGVFTGLVLSDWRQTKEFRSKGRAELNPIMGEQPTQERIDTVIFLSIVSHSLIAWALPPDLRNKWQLSFIFIESYAVTINSFSAGMSVSF